MAQRRKAIYEDTGDVAKVVQLIATGISLIAGGASLAEGRKIRREEAAKAREKFEANRKIVPLKPEVNEQS